MLVYLNRLPNFKYIEEILVLNSVEINFQVNGCKNAKLFNSIQFNIFVHYKGTTITVNKIVHSKQNVRLQNI